MEKIREMVIKLIDECAQKKVPVMVAYGKEKPILGEWGTTDKAPERIKRARTAFVSATIETRSVMEFDQ